MGHEGLDLHTNRDLDKSEDQSFKTELYARKAEEIIRSHNYESVSGITVLRVENNTNRHYAQQFWLYCFMTQWE